ncbi:MAG: FAD:protein FMN transferase [Candidatus Omnitrophica bacterium]|nr:FAD:protein FMN transferase [Candidatus Omnitrophota bacterium]
MIRRLAIGCTVLFFYSLPCFAFEKLTSAEHFLGTRIDVTVCYEAGTKQQAVSAVDAVWARFSVAHAHMNLFDPLSDLSKIRRAAGETVQVQDDVYALIETSKKYKAVSGGVFDVTIGSLSDLWTRASLRNAIPSSDEIRQARGQVDAGRIELLGNGRVRVPSDMVIDLGGDAAGYLADKSAGILRQAGFMNFLVNAGGEIYAGGRSCQGRPWRVGINKPQGGGRISGVVELQDAAVSTSGSYERYWTIKGQHWSHIINPVTGYPAQDVISATVIAPTALEADIFSTALSVLGPLVGNRLIERMGPGYAAMITAGAQDGQLLEYSTAGYSKFKSIR